ncbi:MAG: sigma-70 family RNA polymerase sigma factor [Myxococcota bacterium]
MARKLQADERHEADGEPGLEVAMHEHEEAEEASLAEPAEPADGPDDAEIEREAERVEEAPTEEAQAAPAAQKRRGRAAASGDREFRNFLAMYFREMAALSVLRPEEEFSAARTIESLEVALWETLLGLPPAIDLVLRVVERGLDNSLREFRTLRERARRFRERPTRPQLARLHEVARASAARLRPLDIDRRIVALVMQELDRVGRGEAPRIATGRLAFNPQSAVFRKYLADARAARDHVQSAKNAFVRANLRLVVSIARRFNYGRMPFADLIQEGNIGLMKAVDRFDYRRGYRFSTYASWWIRHAISRALADKGRAVRLPVHMIDTYHRVAKASRELTTKLGRPPTADEIGAAAGVEGEKVEKMRTYLLEDSLSLDRPVSGDDERRFIDFLTEPEGTPTVIDKLSTRAITEEVLRLLDELKPMESDILRQRFGLDTDEELTLKQIGEKYHLSRERIRQLQEQALLKVRRALERKSLL